MIVIGIIGGIASGKSFVAKIFESFGAYRIDADQLGHQVLAEKETIQRIKDIWGDRVFDSNGNVSRPRLAEIVFECHSELQKLEQITHPRIESLIIQSLAQLTGNHPAVVIDAPVLIKAGWHQHCDKIVFVECSLECRIERAILRGWTQEMFERREASQTPLEAKKALATDVVQNSSDSDQIQRQLRELWNRWELR